MKSHGVSKQRLLRYRLFVAIFRLHVLSLRKTKRCQSHLVEQVATKKLSSGWAFLWATENSAAQQKLGEVAGVHG